MRRLHICEAPEASGTAVAAFRSRPRSRSAQSTTNQNSTSEAANANRDREYPHPGVAYGAHWFGFILGVDVVVIVPIGLRAVNLGVVLAMPQIAIILRGSQYIPRWRSAARCGVLRDFAAVDFVVMAALFPRPSRVAVPEDAFRGEMGSGTLACPTTELASGIGGLSPEN